MAEEVRITGYDVGGGGGGGGSGSSGGGGEDDDRVLEWEAGLPNVDDLTPLSQSLISAELLSAFSITPEPHRNMTDVNRASQTTLSNMTKFSSVNSFDDGKGDEMVVEEVDLGSRKLRRVDSGGDAVEIEEDETETGVLTDARTSKRPRLVWTPQLHKRFVEVVAHLGVKNAVPKTIMQLMNVEGLTRENVASHLQKYRLYLKRMQTGLSTPHAPSSSDHLFASTPIPHESVGNNGHRYAPPPYPSNQMFPMRYPSHQMVPNSSSGGGGGGGGYNHGFDSNSYHPYNMNNYG